MLSSKEQPGVGGARQGGGEGHMGAWSGDRSYTRCKVRVRQEVGVLLRSNQGNTVSTQGERVLAPRVPGYSAREGAAAGTAEESESEGAKMIRDEMHHGLGRSCLLSVFLISRVTSSRMVESARQSTT